MLIDKQSLLLNHPNTVLKPVASKEQMRISEEILGFRLPVLLRDFYQQVGNGAFFPGGFHLYGVQGGYDYDGKYIHDFYRHVMADKFRNPGQVEPTLFLHHNAIVANWPEKLLPVGLWGPAADIFSLYLDCTVETLPVYFFDISGLHPKDRSVPGPITFLYTSFVDCLVALQRDVETGKCESADYVNARFEADRAVTRSEGVRARAVAYLQSVKTNAPREPDGRRTTSSIILTPDSGKEFSDTLAELIDDPFAEE
jgi:hypothetical protein